MTQLVVLLCLFLTLPIQGRDPENDLQKEIDFLSRRLESLEEKDKKIDALEQQVSTLKTQIEELQKHAIDTSIHVMVDDAMKQMNLNQDNKTIEERIEALEEKSKLNIRRSCYEYWTYGLTTSGLYQIDPDGELIGSQPIEVFCDFSDGSTQLLHDRDYVVEIDPCPEPECYNLTINYQASDSQIEALKDLSNECFQEIAFDCFQSVLASYGDPIGFWLDRMGDRQIYYVGENYDHHICSCGLDDSCSESEHGFVCNCDAAQIPATQQDRGLITNVTALPIKGFLYGEMRYESQYAAIQIGRMTCKGMKHIESDHLMDSCSNLKVNGVTISANYVLNDNSVAFCDMTEAISDPSIQQHIGNIHYTDNDPDPPEPNPMFMAQLNSGSFIATGTVSFTEELVDVGNVFDPATGTFTSPQDGIYEFHFNAFVNSGSHADMKVKLNGHDKILMIDDEDTGDDRQLTSYFALDLKQDDQVSLENYVANTIYISSNYPLNFKGSLVA